MTIKKSSIKYAFSYSMLSNQFRLHVRVFSFFPLSWEWCKREEAIDHKVTFKYKSNIYLLYNI